MQIFLVVPLTTSTAAINAAVERGIDQRNRYHLQEDKGWLVGFDGTTIEVSNHLGITGQEKGTPNLVGSAIVVPVTTYYGRGSTDMWEWLKTRLER